jgi:S-adenosylmethionine:tRNA ribosyltransferase-isomerase
MQKDLYSLSSYLFELPEELIAQHPCSPRDHSRVMVIDRKSGKISEMVFHELLDFLQAGDQLVFNNTKVIPSRLIGKRESGGITEVFITKLLPNGTWEVMARPGRKLRKGSKVIFGPDFSCEILDTLSDGGKIVRFLHQGNFDELLEKYGQIPLPHYIHREEQNAEDKENYQTMYAEVPGAVAAPTAGLHFTKEMLSKLAKKNISQPTVTLHVGIGTFRPVQSEDIRLHPMHSEHVIITPDAALKLNNRPLDRRQICVGTTSCRALESASAEDGTIPAGEYDTSIFIYPGYRFKYVKSMLTNFHLPGSSLLMLVSAFAGYDLIMEAYSKAVREKYRFFSYGDAMLIL